VVHIGSVCFLAPADDGHQYREKAKGLLGDVLAPHYHNHFDIHELLLPQHKGWKPYSLHDGSCRYHSSRKLLFLLTPLEISNIVFYRQRNASNISAILPFAITSLACL
jgi:hypothetical protein